MSFFTVNLIGLFLNTVLVKSLQLCLTLCKLIDCSPAGSSVHGILQARILEWTAMPSSRGSSSSRGWTHSSYVSCIGRFFTTSVTCEAHILILLHAFYPAVCYLHLKRFHTITFDLIIIKIMWTTWNTVLLIWACVNKSVPWKKNYDKPRQHIKKKNRDITLPTKVCVVKAMVFPVVMYVCENWTIKKADTEELMFLNCGVREDSWESLGLQGDPTSPS